MHRNIKCRTEKVFREGLRWTVVLLLCLVMAGSVFAASASEEGVEKQQEQWVFLLAAPEDASECRFFANPSLAGYEAGEDTEIQLSMAIGDRNYDIMLYPSKERSGWYASEAYNIAASAWEMDYEVTLKMTEGGSIFAEERLTKKDMAAEWPAASDGQLKLKKDNDGRMTDSEFEWNQWMKSKDSPLFIYKIENQEGCEAVLDQAEDKIRIIKASDGGSFVLAAEDPAGNRRMAKVDIVVAGQMGNSVATGMMAVVVIGIIVIAVFVVKHFADGRNSGENQLVQARAAVDQVRQRLDYLVRDMEALSREIEQAGRAAEDRVRQDGAASAYSLVQIRELEAAASGLEEDVSFGNLKQILCVLKDISGQLLKMQGKAKVNISKGGPAVENPKNYINEASRKDILSKIEPDENMTRELYIEMQANLKTLKEVAYREEMPFCRDMDILVEVNGGQRQYRGKRVAKDAYGVNMPGVFSIDSIRFLSGEGSLMTLPEILNHETDVRLFAIDENRIRAVAVRAVFVDGGRKTRIVEYTYDEDAEIILEDVKIILHFKR